MIASAANPPDFPAADSSALQRWQSNRFGMFIHFDPSCLTGEEISWSRAGERRDRGEDVKDGTPAAEYDTLYRQFNPTNFNARTWVQTAKSAGMKYIVFTAKHHDGFAMFDSKLTDYKITKSPFGRDLCAELAEACHEAGISLGFYYSPPDWHQPDFFTTNYVQYIKYMHGQVRELLSNYGQVDELWFDATGGTNTPETWNNQELFPMIRELQPQILVTTRCGGWGDFDTPEQRIGGFQNDTPWETCMTICQQWSWKPDDHMKSLAQCIKTLVLCAGGDGNLLLNVGPMPDGEIEPRQVSRLKEIGVWLDKNGESIYGTHGGPWKPTKALASTRKGDVIYLHILKNGSQTIELPIELPDIAAKIKSASILGGGQVKFTREDGKLIFNVPFNQRNELDTVLKLQLASSAMNLPAVELSPTFKATASSVYGEDDGGYAAQLAFDGDDQTRWATDDGTRQAWVAIDFLKPQTVNHVRISEAYAGRVQKFEPQYLDGDEWKTIFAGTTLGDNFQKSFSAVTAREFRLNILKATNGPTINEIELMDKHL
ncbi:MAG: alpha-L-fucosidase [Limisphaerales bacterium]